jgi:hypothetical protein
MLRFLAVSVVLAFVVFTWGQSAGQKPGGAPHPKWSQREVERYFADARTVLGDPSLRNTAASPVGPSVNPGGPVAPAPEAGPTYPWSRLISPASIEDEVKLVVALTEEDVKTPGKFKGGGFEKVRVNYTELAVIFGVIGQYDQTVRWKAEGPGMREALARAARNAKTATDNTFDEAEKRYEELAELIRGGSVPDLKEAEPVPVWGDLVDISPLMKRLDAAYESRLKAWTSDKGEFDGHKDYLLREAEVFAVYGQLFQDETVENGDDEVFRQYGKEFQDLALAAAEATRTSDFDAAQAAVVAIGQSCNKCHGDFRGS